MAPGTPGPDLPGVWSYDQIRQYVDKICPVAKHTCLVPLDDGRCEGVVECCQAAGCFNFALEEPCKHDPALCMAVSCFAMQVYTCVARKCGNLCLVRCSLAKLNWCLDTIASMQLLHLNCWPMQLRAAGSIRPQMVQVLVSRMPMAWALMVDG